MQPKTEKRPYLEGFLINYKHIAWSDKSFEEKEKVTEDHAGLICPVCEKGRLIPLLVVHRTGQVISSAASVLFSNRLAWDTS